MEKSLEDASLGLATGSNAASLLVAELAAVAHVFGSGDRVRPESLTSF